MHSQHENKIISDGAYFYALFGLLVVWCSTIGCTRYYSCHFSILRILHSYCEMKRSGDGDYISALFGLFIARSITMR